MLDENFNLLGIKLVGTEYIFDVRGDLQTVDGPSGQPEVVGGTVHSGQIYTVERWARNPLTRWVEYL